MSSGHSLLSTVLPHRRPHNEHSYLSIVLDPHLPGRKEKLHRLMNLWVLLVQGSTASSYSPHLATKVLHIPIQGMTRTPKLSWFTRLVHLVLSRVSDCTNCHPRMLKVQNWRTLCGQIHKLEWSSWLTAVQETLILSIPDLVIQRQPQKTKNLWTIRGAL